ncbi:hypothetical protein BDV95DRAFT_3083 [Massariosphaeria phaeospora]|uniref:Uncharacterized protein n=1 Tax=Massariosphaeria phaeospora TaxID=100035 RepID=A0A7C8IQS3_9PLEO|nr:hypothetical protein BDV95DRAFT_3083 [Massariosphaeria phaeospora]
MDAMPTERSLHRPAQQQYQNRSSCASCYETAFQLKAWSCWPFSHHAAGDGLLIQELFTDKLSWVAKRLSLVKAQYEYSSFTFREGPTTCPEPGSSYAKTTTLLKGRANRGW